MKISTDPKKKIDYSDPKFHHGRGLVSKKQREIILRAFIRDDTAVSATDQAGVGSAKNQKVTLRQYRLFREAIYAHTSRAPRFIGVVEMDQKEFGGRGRKRTKSLLARYKKLLTYHEYQIKAIAIRKEHKTKVFGVLERDTQRVYVHIIKREDKRTLMPLIRLIVQEGSTVYTDKWRGFSDLKIDGYDHHTINHSEEYVTRAGEHANTIESFWSFAERRLRKFNGIHRTTLPLHLKECEYRWNHRDDLAVALKAILESKSH